MRERDIFIEALQKPPVSRGAFVDDACHGDADLRERVQSLLNLQSEARSFLEPTPVATVLSDQATECPGAQVGPYKLLEQIGEGGFGVVFMAEQSRPVRRKVALKVLKPGMDTRQVIARFEAERQALALMDHPNIARILDAGTTGEVEGKASRVEGTKSLIAHPSSLIPRTGRPYFVMELVKGIPITEYCDQQRLNTRDRLALFVDVCHAVQHAHQKGIIHRDLKPTNVLVTQHDGQPLAKVIDFGIAKALGQQLTDKTLFTGFAQLIGTPLYMSPEQAALSDVDVDTRSDVYSLGVLLYELLTGTTPFDKESLSNASYDELRRIIREDEPPRPSARISTLAAGTRSTIASRHQVEPQKLGHQLRGELDWIVMRALEKDRNRRYESASAFAADVERYLHDEPVQACPPSAAYRFRKFARRHRIALSTVALVSIALVVGMVGTSIGLMRALRAERIANLAAQAEARQRRDAESLRDRAKTAEAQAKEEAAIAEAVNEFLQEDLLAEAAPERNARDKQVTVEELLGRAADRIGGRFSRQPRVEAAIRQTIGNTYRALGNYAAAQAHLERALELHSRATGEQGPDAMYCMNDLAGLYEDQGRYEEAESLFRKTLEARRRLFGEANPDTIDSMNNLAELYRRRGRLADAEPLFVKSLELSRRVRGEHDPGTLIIMNNLAVLYLGHGLFAKAEPLLVRVVEVRSRDLGAENADTLTAMNNLSEAYLGQGRHADAERLLAGVLELSRRVRGEDHPHTLTVMSNLARAYWSANKLDLSVPLFEEAVKKSRAKLGPDHPHTLLATANLAINYRDAGRLSDAIALLERVWGRPGLPAGIAMQVAAALADSYGLAGRFSEAEPLLREALQEVQMQHGEASLPASGALAALGLNLLKQQRYADAEPLLRECLTIREGDIPEHWSTFNAKSMLGGALLGLENYGDAEELLVAGYAGMKQREGTIPPQAVSRQIEAIERLVQLYEAKRDTDKADEWRARLLVLKPAKAAVSRDE